MPTVKKFIVTASPTYRTSDGCTRTILSLMRNPPRVEIEAATLAGAEMQINDWHRAQGSPSVAVSVRVEGRKPPGFDAWANRFHSCYALPMSDTEGDAYLFSASKAA